MASIAFVVDQIKKDPSRILDHLPVEQVCRQLHVDFRDRRLNPATTVGLLVRQVIAGNCSCAAVRHHDGGGGAFTPQAYCKARQRLPLAVLQTLCRELCDRAREGGRRRPGAELLPGQRVFVIDGSSFSMPDTPELQRHFGQPGAQKPGCGFPVAHLLAMFDLETGMLVEAVASPLRTHDLRHAASRMHPLMGKGDLLLGDTGFCSYTHFALLLQAGLHGLMPNHQRRIVDFTPRRPFVGPEEVTDQNRHLPRSRWVRSLGADDQLVEWFKPGQRPAYLSKEEFDTLPESIVVRELRRRVWRAERACWTELVIVTTLLDAGAYPAGTLVDLRLQRWTVEVNLRHLKTTMGLEVLKCKTVKGVGKELAAFVLVYNAVRLLMQEAARRQETTPDRISFTDVLSWLSVAGPGRPMPVFVVNPHRPGRIEPRAVKRRPKEYDRLNRPRDQMRKTLINSGKSA